jgi:hypothetical protein
MSNTERVVLYIDSKHRTSGTSENFTLQLSTNIAKIQQVEVISAEVPYTFYVINSTNCAISWSSGATVYTANVPVGNYTITTFLPALQTAMNAVMAGFTVTYSTVTFKITFANATAFSILGTSTISDIIGLSGTTASAASVTLPRVFNIGGPKYLLIRSTKLTQPKITRPFLNSTQNNILYKIDINGSPGDILVEKNLYTNMLKYGVRQTIRTIDFQLTDDNGNLIDLNGLDWSLTLNLVIG